MHPLDPRAPREMRLAYFAAHAPAAPKWWERMPHLHEEEGPFVTLARQRMLAHPDPEMYGTPQQIEEFLDEDLDAEIECTQFFDWRTFYARIMVEDLARVVVTP
jgi:hypothetical protein